MDQTSLKGNAGTILVSAHPDDVALSIGGSVLAGFFESPLILVTVFSRGGWAGNYNGTYEVEKVTRMRAIEDESFAAAIGSRLLSLGLNDAKTESLFGKGFNMQRWVSSIIRGWPPPNDSRLESGIEEFTESIPRVLRWSMLRRLATLDRVYSDLRSKLFRVFSQFPDAAVVSPLALGLHPDHVLVACACRELVKVDRVYYYEDLPYARGYRSSGIRRHIAFFDHDLRPVLVDVDNVMQAKLGNLRIYVSQLGQPDFGKVLRHARGLSATGRAYERLWMHNRSGDNAMSFQTPQIRGM